MTALLTILVLVFITVAIWQMVKIFDLAQAGSSNSGHMSTGARLAAISAMNSEV